MISRLMRALCALALLLVSPAPALAEMQFSNPVATSPVYGSGRYYMPEGTLGMGGGQPMTAGHIRCYPGFVRSPVTVSSMSVRISTLAAAGNFQIAVYAASALNGDPTGAPIYTSASQSTAAAVLIEATGASFRMARGIYWFCVQADNGTVAFIGPTTAVPLMQQLSGTTGTSNILLSAGNSSCYTKAGTYGTWPTLTGNIATDSLVEQSSFLAALVAFKAT